MTPMQDPGIQHSLNFLEQAPFIGVVIAIFIFGIAFLVKQFLKKK